MNTMTRVLLSTGLAGAAIVAGAPAFAAAASAGNASGEAVLAKMLAGREAGKPESCISLVGSPSSEIIDGTAVVFRQGSTLWVNRPTNASTLRRDDILVIRTSMPQLCRVDIVNLRDQASHFWKGTVSLQDFVPYRRVGA